jgi:epoxyqueuosine reductase
VTPAERNRRIKAHAHGLGFEAVGIATLEPTPHGAALRRWLDAGHAGTMTYMHRQAARRSYPAAIVPGATRAVMVSRSYMVADTPGPGGRGHVAKYARGADYHDTLRAPLQALTDYVRSLGGTETIARPYVDAGPVPERELAQRAGLGWIGKNTMLISPRYGSYCFLASVLTDLDVAPDAPFEADRCGRCRRCLDACPTQAFPEPRVLDSRRCISYLTIEHRAPIASELAVLMGDWVFGCDVCQAVCPWNLRFAHPREDPRLERQLELEWLDLTALAGMGDSEFARRFGHTPLRRPGAAVMRRNAAIASANGVADAGE